MATKLTSKVSKAGAQVAAQNQAERQAAIWAVLAGAAGKEGVRDALPDGCGHVVHAVISGEVDGHPFEPIAIDGVLAVGHESQRAASQTPNANGLIAFLLGKMNEATRAACIATALKAVASGGDYPASECEEEAANFLKSLRASRPSTIRGSVSVKHQIS